MTVEVPMGFLDKLEVKMPESDSFIGISVIQKSAFGIVIEMEEGVYVGGDPYPILSLNPDWKRMPPDAEDKLGELPLVMGKYKLDAWTTDQQQNVVSIVSQTSDGGWQSS